MLEFYLRLSAHCRRGYIFCLETKEAKIQVSKEASSAQAFARQAGKTTGCKILPLLRSLMAPASGKYCYSLADPHGQLVLPAVIRIFFADRKKIKYKIKLQRPTFRTRTYAAFAKGGKHRHCHSRNFKAFCGSREFY